MPNNRSPKKVEFQEQPPTVVSVKSDSFDADGNGKPHPVRDVLNNGMMASKLKNTLNRLKQGRRHEFKHTGRSDSESEKSRGLDQSKVAVVDIEKLAQKSGTNTEHERFRVVPDYSYPNTKFNREELRKEMNLASSYYHDLRPENHPQVCVGAFYLEILQCFGIPRPELMKEISAFCIAVCGSHAFKTDVMPPVANPMWLSKMRRAVIFPLHQAYARVAIGVFGKSDFANTKDMFIGRVVVDMARLRPGCTYDVTLPLRQYSNVFSRQQRGAIRFRFHLEWHNERRALLSYLPKQMPRFQPHEKITVRCCDNKAFQNVHRVVHGYDSPGRFSMKLVKATMREVNFVRVHILRYLRKRQINELMEWRHPSISLFVFLAWMQSVYVGNMAYVPGHFITYLLLQIWKNYAFYVIDGKHDNGFSAPTWEEMMSSLINMGKGERNHIIPLTMKRKLEDDAVASALQHFEEDDDSKKKPSIQTIANALREGVKRSGKSKSYFFRSEPNTFAGTDAVDFLVNQKYAETRKEAVELGRRLEKDLRLFEHKSRKYEFKDSDLYYVFLNFDTSKYVFKTHRPWFKTFFRVMGIRKNVPDSAAHWEFPFATGADHPRFTVQESLVIRSKASRNLLQTMNQQEEMEDVDALGVTAYKRKMDATRQFNHMVALDGVGKPSLNDARSIGSFQSTRSVDIEVDLINSDDEDDFEQFEVEDADMEVKHLAKPPNQDIDFIKTGDRKVSELMVETRHNVHQLAGHVFNDRPYKLTLLGDKRGKESRILRRPSQVVGHKRSKFPFVSGRSKKNVSVMAKFEDPEKTRKLALTSRKDEYDRLLHIGKYSHNNVIVSKVSVIVQPIIEIVQFFLNIFRALFNIFTWRDPFYTFWVVIIGSAVVVLLHLFPWRIALGLAGLAFVGPQNWVYRVMRERKNGKPDEEDLDKVVSKRKVKRPDEEFHDISYFSSFAPDNRPVREDQLDTSDFKEVAVPHTPLNYRRFYDWPPEPSYARVWTSKPPGNDPVAEGLLEADAFELYDGSYGDEASIEPRGWGNRGRRLVSGVRRVARKPKIPKPLRRRKNKLEKLDEVSALY